ncbi:hypothetical protein C8F04DRAFT_1195315 [Mycena alexandri]|uniref:Uncharacterized protein n=1 Tax=Mycena alexandri TaxID=1745969 RepID=A0AAD6S9C4_9AGAR|nr:hypothetical protein C8F04DRAFT_1195315 [Mycena alexandri]
MKKGQGRSATTRLAALHYRRRKDWIALVLVHLGLDMHRATFQKDRRRDLDNCPLGLKIGKESSIAESRLVWMSWTSWGRNADLEIESLRRVVRVGSSRTWATRFGGSGRGGVLQRCGAVCWSWWFGKSNTACGDDGVDGSALFGGVHAECAVGNIKSFWVVRNVLPWAYERKKYEISAVIRHNVRGKNAV